MIVMFEMIQIVMKAVNLLESTKKKA